MYRADTLAFGPRSRSLIQNEMKFQHESLDSMLSVCSRDRCSSQRTTHDENDRLFYHEDDLSGWERIDTPSAWLEVNVLLDHCSRSRDLSSSAR